MDSTGALDLPDVPQSLLVVGGGYIGLELGTVYAALGTKVTVVEMTDGLLPGADRDLVNILAQADRDDVRGGAARTRRSPAMKEAGDGIAVTFEGKLPDACRASATFDRVLVSIGRRPNSAVPGLDKTGSRSTSAASSRWIRQRRTAEPTILRDRRRGGRADAGPQGVARGAGRGRGDRRHKAAFEPLAIPAVVFTDPELAWCGLTESEAAEAEDARSRWPASRGRRPAARSRSTAPTA